MQLLLALAAPRSGEFPVKALWRREKFEQIFERKLRIFVCVSHAYPLLRSAGHAPGIRLYSLAFGKNVILWDSGMQLLVHLIHYSAPFTLIHLNKFTLSVAQHRHLTCRFSSITA